MANAGVSLASWRLNHLVTSQALGPEIVAYGNNRSAAANENINLRRNRENAGGWKLRRRVGEGAGAQARKRHNLGHHRIVNAGSRRSSPVVF